MVRVLVQREIPGCVDGRRSPWVLALGLLAGCTSGVTHVGSDSSPATTDSSVNADSQESGSESATDSGDTTGCGQIALDPTGYAALFDASVVHTIAITLTDADKAALIADPGTYVTADVVVDGTALAGVGLKMHGNSDQERWEAKPGLKVSLRTFGNCDPYANVDHLYLDANSDDPTQSKLVVSAQILANAGRVAPKATFMTVTVNGDSLGLYSNVEVVEGNFVADHEPEGGVLWSASDGADFSERGGSAWSDVNGGGDSATIDAVTAVVASAGDDFYTQADVLVDMDDFLSHWAWLAAIGHQKSYPYATKDVYLFAPASDGRFEFVPWALDEGWDPTFGWNYVESALALRCVYDATCSAALKTHIQTALATADAMDVPAIASAAFTLSNAAVSADTRRGTTAADVATARADLLAAMQTWPATVGSQLP